MLEKKQVKIISKNKLWVHEFLLTGEYGVDVQRFKSEMSLYRRLHDFNQKNHWIKAVLSEEPLGKLGLPTQFKDGKAKIHLVQLSYQPFNYEKVKEVATLIGLTQSKVQTKSYPFLTSVNEREVQHGFSLFLTQLFRVAIDDGFNFTYTDCFNGFKPLLEKHRLFLESFRLQFEVYQVQTGQDSYSQCLKLTDSDTALAYCYKGFYLISYGDGDEIVSSSCPISVQDFELVRQGFLARLERQKEQSRSHYQWDDLASIY